MFKLKCRKYWVSINPWIGIVSAQELKYFENLITSEVGGEWTCLRAVAHCWIPICNLLAKVIEPDGSSWLLCYACDNLDESRLPWSILAVETSYLILIKFEVYALEGQERSPILLRNILSLKHCFLVFLLIFFFMVYQSSWVSWFFIAFDWVCEVSLFGTLEGD